MKRSLALIGIIAISVLSACATRSLVPAAEPSTRQSLGGAGGGPVAPEVGAPPFANDSSKSSAGQNPENPAAPNAPAVTNRLVIQNADLSIVVPDVNARVAAIEAMAKAMGGFIVSVNVSQTYTSAGNQVPQAQIVVRVPQDKLDDALAQVKNGTLDVSNETRTGTDVTDQYVDLQSRLTAKQAAEQQLLKIMDNATKTQDVLEVYAQLQQIQSDIEVLKGQIKFYEQSAAMAALSVNVIAEETVKPIEVGGWKPQGVARDAIQNLIYFWQAFINYMINFFLYVLPVLLTIAIPLYILFLILRWLLRRTRKPKAVVPVEAQDK